MHDELSPEAIGKQAASILRVARESAAEIRARAHRHAEAVIAAAEAERNRMLAEAESLLSAARAAAAAAARATRDEDPSEPSEAEPASPESVPFDVRHRLHGLVHGETIDEATARDATPTPDDGDDVLNVIAMRRSRAANDRVPPSRATTP